MTNKTNIFLLQQLDLGFGITPLLRDMNMITNQSCKIRNIPVDIKKNQINIGTIINRFSVDCLVLQHPIHLKAYYKILVYFEPQKNRSDDIKVNLNLIGKSEDFGKPCKYIDSKEKILRLIDSTNYAEMFSEEEKWYQSVVDIVKGTSKILYVVENKVDQMCIKGFGSVNARRSLKRQILHDDYGIDWAPALPVITFD